MRVSFIIHLLLWASDVETVCQPSHVVHVLRRNVLQVSQEYEEVRMGYLDSTAECSMEAFQDVVCSVPVITAHSLARLIERFWVRCLPA